MIQTIRTLSAALLALALLTPQAGAVGDFEVPSMDTILTLDRRNETAPRFHSAEFQVAHREHKEVLCYATQEYTVKTTGLLWVQAWAKMSGTMTVRCGEKTARYAMRSEGLAVGLRTTPETSKLMNLFKQGYKVKINSVKVRVLHFNDVDRLAGDYGRVGVTFLDGDTSISPFTNTAGSIQIEFAAPKSINTLISLNFNGLTLTKLL